MTQEYDYTLEFQVRDYECDIQGIVNNAVYQNYLEHTRHEFLKSRQVDFAKLANEGINLVVVRAELNYKRPLQSGDRFLVGLSLERESRVKFAFNQEILRLPDKQLMLDAKITGTALAPNGRPKIPDELQAIIA